MIAFLEGELLERAGTTIVIDVGGVGYEIQVPTSVLAGLPSVGTRLRVHIRMIVREDSMTLYGFRAQDERALFDLLTGVSGVGPKVALNFLSALPTDGIRRAIVGGDVDALTVVPGVGKKVAQRVVLDLREKLGGVDDAIITGPLVDVREALVSLGLTPSEASQALADVDPGERDVEELLREALRKVGR